MEKLEFLTPLETGAIETHEIFLSYKSAGFTSEEALTLVGILLMDNEEAATQIKKMSYDGRLPNIPWRDQDIDTLGYHYYMTPETAQLGLQRFQEVVDVNPRRWTYKDYPDLRAMSVFK